MLNADALDTLFRTARTHNGWLDQPVTDEDLHRLYDLMKMAPTSANCSPARIVFVRSANAKARLQPALGPGNLEKTMAAPVTAIIGYDLQFAEHMPRLFPHNPDAKNWFSDPKVAEVVAFRNGTLQGAYFILAARAVGLDTGPMSGFDNAQVDAEFFPGGRVRSNFLCNLGHGDSSKLFARSPRLEFGEACQVL